MSYIKYSILSVLLVTLIFSTTSCEPDTEVESLTLSPKSLIMSIGSTETLVATFNPENAEDKAVTWMSTHKEVALVDANGTVSAIAEGTSIVTARTNNGKSASCMVSVVKPLTSISIVQSSLSLNQGDTARLLVNYLPVDATYKEVVWSSTAPRIAMVSKSGLVTAINSGVAVITATSVDGNLTSSCVVNVDKIPVDLYYTSQEQNLYRNDTLYQKGSMILSELIVSDGTDYYTEAFCGTYFRNGEQMADYTLYSNRFVELHFANDTLYSCSYGPGGVFAHFVRGSQVITIDISSDPSATACGIAVVANGDIYVGGNRKISGKQKNVLWHYNKHTKAVTESVLSDGLSGTKVAVDNHGDVLALVDANTSSGKNALQLFKNGVLESTLSNTMFASSQFLDNKAMIFKNGNLYIAASVYTSNVPQVMVWRNSDWIYTIPSTNSELKFVTDIEVDIYGNVYVAGYDSANGNHGSIWINGGELYFYDTFFIRNIAAIVKQ